MSRPHRFGRCHRGAARSATNDWLFADQLLTPDEQLLAINREKLVENTHSKPPNTRIEIQQCGYLNFTVGSQGWQGKFLVAGRAVASRHRGYRASTLASQTVATPGKLA